MSELHDLAPLYALHALDKLEEARFERHLHGCEPCQQAVAGYRESTSSLAEITRSEPPPHLRERVLSLAATTRQEPARGESAAAMSYGPARWAAAALILVVGLGWWMSQSDQRLIDSVLRHPDAVTVSAQPTPDGLSAFSEVRVVVVPGEGRALLLAEGLRPLEPNRVYAVWVIDSDGAHPAGLFRPARDGTAEVIIEGDVIPGVVVAMTVEPEGGSDIPTGSVLLTAET